MPQSQSCGIDDAREFEAVAGSGVLQDMRQTDWCFQIGTALDEGIGN